MKKIFVRLMPVNPKLGFTVRQYSYRGQKYIGGDRPVWYLVDKDLADDLRTHRQDHTDLRSALLFQVVSEEEKVQIETQEQTTFLTALGAVASTVSAIREITPPRTEDIRTETQTAPAGRAAAVPPPRAATRKATPTASLQDVKEESPAGATVAVAETPAAPATPVPLPAPAGLITTNDVLPERRRRKDGGEKP